MPGLWRGTVVMSDPKYVSTAGATPAYLSVFQNLAPNVWLFLDPKDETKIASANVGLMRSVVRNPDGSFEFHNEAWKSFPGPEHVAGRDDWCNAFVLVKNDQGDAQIVMLSNSRRTRRATTTTRRSARSAGRDGFARRGRRDTRRDARRVSWRRQRGEADQAVSDVSVDAETRDARKKGAKRETRSFIVFRA